jgi:hypothetical protein
MIETPKVKRPAASFPGRFFTGSPKSGMLFMGWFILNDGKAAKWKQN